MNDYNQWNNSGPNTVYMNEKFQYETLSNYTAKTFLWMFAGLLVTFGVSLAAYMSNIGFYLLRSSFTFFGLAILEIVLVVAGIPPAQHERGFGPGPVLPLRGGERPCVQLLPVAV